MCYMEDIIFLLWSLKMVSVLPTGIDIPSSNSESDVSISFDRSYLSFTHELRSNAERLNAPYFRMRFVKLFELDISIWFKLNYTALKNMTKVDIIFHISVKCLKKKTLWCVIRFY